MPKRRERRGKSTRATPQTAGPRRSNRLLYIVIMLLTALSMMALVVAGFLNYSTPSVAPGLTPTLVPIATPRAIVAPQLPIVVTFPEGWF
ncbi:MAG TPA: hypothetical protein VNG11_05150 [Chloroflexota bacterium]|nr:hypothetical protein [Chloroflexota bacterium]